MILKTILAGLNGDALARHVTNSNEVCAERSTIATVAGTGFGYAACAGTVATAKAVGFTALAAGGAPLVLPVALGAGAVALLRSRFS